MSSGVADLEMNLPVGNATLYQLSSTAKIFTGTTLMTLVEDGLVTLDARVGQYLPEIPAEWQHVTVRQLLTHTSGLPDLVTCDDRPEADAVACALELGDPAPPGDRFSYNQTNYYLVQKIIEQVSGVAFPDLVAQRMFERFGITEFVYAGASDVPVPGRARSYYPDGAGGLEPRIYRFPDYLFAAAGLNVSLNGAVTWVQALEGDRILSPEARAAMWQEPTLNDGRVSTYAMGWDLKTHAPGHRSAGHSGGNLTTVRMFLRDSVSVVVLANGSSQRLDPDRLAEELAALIVPAVQTPAERLASEMRALLVTSGIDSVLQRLIAVMAAPGTLDHEAEAALNRLGYELLDRNRAADAVEVLRLVVEAFPDSWNAHDSLGEAYLAYGDWDAARSHYSRSVELNPDNDNGRAALRELGES
jgi:CubicO group peptidase (beta-lactamase class C family)